MVQRGRWAVSTGKDGTDQTVGKSEGLDLRQLGKGHVIGAALADVAVMREKARVTRFRKLAILLGFIAAWFWGRYLNGTPIKFGWPNWPSGLGEFAPALLLILFLLFIIGIPMLGAGRSPHITYRPGEIEISFDDVKGLGMVMDEVVKSLNLFLGFRTFQLGMGGRARRAILFEGPPGTGKTYMAKAMANVAGVPFLFVSSSAFQSMYYGQTNRKIRTYFKALRAVARKEGGAIGFIEEIDAIGSSRAGMGRGGEGVTGVVNELLIQLQSFDTPPRYVRVQGWFIDQINRWLPLHRQIRRPKPDPANILVIGATNRASDLDPALVRPGRFDRSVHFDLPNRQGRREIIDYYLDKKAHSPELDEESRRNALAAMTFGYSPAMIEHILDEALVWALRRGATQMDWSDVQQAKFTEEIGLKQPVEYTPDERARIATHEAGHATVAHLVGKDRKLEVLSIIKRREALGLLAHSEVEERYTKNRSELTALIQIALGGMVSEELFFGEAGTGVSGDLSGATRIAAQMVGAMGMAGSLISYDAIEGPGVGNIVHKTLALEPGRRAVEDIMGEAKQAVEKMIWSNAYIVEALRDSLLEKDELIGEEILEVINVAVQRRNGKPPSKGNVIGLSSRTNSSPKGPLG